VKVLKQGESRVEVALDAEAKTIHVGVANRRWDEPGPEITRAYGAWS
jgi:hypothetical protein